MKDEAVKKVLLKQVDDESGTRHVAFHTAGPDAAFEGTAEMNELFGDESAEFHRFHY